MIKELSDFGKTIRLQKKDDQWVHDALKEEIISVEIIINENGEFLSFNRVDNIQTIAEAITAKKGKARLLLDKAEEVLCYGGEKSKRKHEWFLEKLNTFNQLSELKPVVAFYNQNKTVGLEKALEEFEKAFSEKERKGNLGFRISSDSERIHEKPAVLNKIIEKYNEREKELLQKNQKICSLCGKSDYPVEDIPHGMIKKVPNGQSMGCALVSYNENAFESYFLVGNENASICTNCSKTYVEGFNHLLSYGNEILETDKKGKEKKLFRYTNRKNFGSDTAMIFWTCNNKEVSEIDQLEAPNPNDIARLIDSVKTGKGGSNPYIDEELFYSCTISGSSARVAVRDWIETTLFDFKTSIANWFKDIAIKKYNDELKKTETHYARLYDLARSCQRKNTDGSYDKDDASLARVATKLWNSALKNTAPPWWILAKVLQRARLDKHGVTADRAALIKLILNRNRKEGGFVMTENLAEGKKPVAYVCGQIFAKIESIQYAALGEINAGIRERYFTYAMMSPSAAFGRLFNLNSKHFTKLKNEKPGLAVNLDKELQDLCKDISIDKFPGTFSLEEQGQFAIGYYHQRQKQFSSQSETR